MWKALYKPECNENDFVNAKKTSASRVTRQPIQNGKKTVWD